MSIEQNKAIVRAIFEDIISAGNLALVDTLYAPDMVDHAARPGSPPGPAGAKHWFTMLRTGFPDVQVTVEDILAEGDKVAVRVTPRATHHGAFLGIPPTGKPITISATHLFRVVGGQVVEHWGTTDMLGLLQQLGAIPPSGQATREGGT